MFWKEKGVLIALDGVTDGIKIKESGEQVLNLIREILLL
jgi:hypothetical protein